MRDTYPSNGDLAQLFVSAGITYTETSGLLLKAYCDAASADWERHTGYLPFLGDTTDVSRVFSPPGNEPRTGLVLGYRGGLRKLDVRAGLLSVTSLVVGYSSTYAGTALTSGVDWWLEPENAAAERRPYQWIQFRVPQWGQPQSIRITGRWGYWSQVPDDAWLAILYGAGVRALSQVQASDGGGLEQIALADNRYTFSKDGPYAATLKGWADAYNRTLAYYKLA